VASRHGREFVVADIPGLIEGAAEGAGIGDRFLGHIERCRVLLHLVDASGDDPVEAWRIVRDELDAYGGGLVDKPEVLALNKIDAIDPKEVTKIAKKLAKVSGEKVLLMSGAAGTGIDEALDHFVEALGPAAPKREEGEEWSPL
jgi:GTP-binding protein